MLDSYIHLQNPAWYFAQKVVSHMGTTSQNRRLEEVTFTPRVKLRMKNKTFGTVLSITKKAVIWVMKSALNP